MGNWFKKLFIPSGEKTTVVAYNSQIVRWKSFNPDYYDSTYAYQKEEAEIFPSEIDANKFADQLKQAMELLKCNKAATSKVRVEPNQSKMATMAQ